MADVCHKLSDSVAGPEWDDHADKPRAYLHTIAAGLKDKGIPIMTMVAESAPVQAILRASEELESDRIMMVSHGRGGVERMDRVKLGSVVEDVIERAPGPVECRKSEALFVSYRSVGNGA